jgi:nicotinamidase-related amidase
MTSPAGPPGPADPAGEGQATLAVIDMQRVFGDRDSPWFTPRFGEIVGPIQRLVDAYRPHVVFTRFVAPAVPTGAWRRYYELWPFALQPPDARIYELVDEFAKEPAPTVTATTFGKVGDELYRMLGSGRLVLTGVSTDCCVLSTALAAADDGVQVQVVADACAGVNDESHAKTLDILRLYSPLVEVVSLDEAIRQAPGPGG